MFFNGQKLKYIHVTYYFLEKKQVVRGVLQKISQNSQENTSARVYFLKKLIKNFIKKETLAQVFSCEFCAVSKNLLFFIEHLWWVLLQEVSISFRLILVNLFKVRFFTTSKKL